MVKDIIELWLKLYGGSEERVPTLLVGHSMGAALAVWAASSGGMKAGLDGVVAVDVVEGTAIGEGSLASGDGRLKNDIPSIII